MSKRFEELAWRETPIGPISLRRRRDPMLGVDVYEVKLGDEFLMSSLFTVAEVELARLGLSVAPDTAGLDVVVGGLGLGYTARAVLDDPRVGALTVVEALDEVIVWHQRGLLPYAAELTTDPRTRLVHGDFFALLKSGTDFTAADSALGDGGRAGGSGGRGHHAILVDIDHSPRHLLHPDNAWFYRPEGLRLLADRLLPGGVFGLWSNDPPDEDFTAALAEVFATCTARVVTFDNPLSRRTSSNTVYLATVDR